MVTMKVNRAFILSPQCHMRHSHTYTHTRAPNSSILRLFPWQFFAPAFENYKFSLCVSVLFLTDTLCVNFTAVVFIIIITISFTSRLQSASLNGSNCWMAQQTHWRVLWNHTMKQVAGKSQKHNIFFFFFENNDEADDGAKQRRNCRTTRTE